MDTIKLCAFGVFIILISGVEGVVYNAYNASMIENPLLDPEACGNHYNAMICDPKNILDYTRVREINESIYSLLHLNHCPCDQCEEGLEGYVFGVLVVPRVKIAEDGEYSSIKRFALQVLDDWQLGSCGNDAIIVVSTEQRKIYTATGARLAMHISDVCIEEANEWGRHHFKDNKWGVGILSILHRYGNLARVGCYKVRGSEYINETWLYGVLAGLSVALLLLLAYVVLKCRGPPPPQKERLP